MPKKVVYTFGQPDRIKNFNHQHINSRPKIVQQSLNDSGELLTDSVKCCFDQYIDKCAVEENRINELGRGVCAKNLNITDGQKADIDLGDYEELSMPGIACQHSITCVGRISCDSDGRMNEASTLLIGHDSITLRSTHLNLAAVGSVSVFPGQVVMVKGRNSQAEQLNVESLYTETAIDLPAITNTLMAPMNIVVAAGPFSAPDDLSYTPFQSLIDHCKKDRPDVLILIGPLIDSDNQFVQDGTMGDDFNEHFDKLITVVSEAVGETCQILVSASCNDARSFVYPTPPDVLLSGKPLTNVQLLPDPCVVDVEGVRIGMTSVDVLQHLLDTELIRQPNQDKIKRTVNYLLHQRSFYPLNPPHPDVMYDSVLASKFSSLSYVPNMMILPGRMRCFVRVCYL